MVVVRMMMMVMNISMMLSLWKRPLQFLIEQIGCLQLHHVAVHHDEDCDHGVVRIAHVRTIRPLLKGFCSSELPTPLSQAQTEQGIAHCHCQPMWRTRGLKPLSLDPKPLVNTTPNAFLSMLPIAAQALVLPGPLS